jgi:hypothetical protein
MLPIYPKSYMQLSACTLDAKHLCAIQYMDELTNGFLTSLVSCIGKGTATDPLSLLNLRKIRTGIEAVNKSNSADDVVFNKNAVLNQYHFLESLIKEFVIEIESVKCFRSLLNTAQTLELMVSALDAVKESVQTDRPLFLPDVPSHGCYKLKHLVGYGHSSIKHCLINRLSDYDTIFSKADSLVQSYWNQMKSLHTVHYENLGCNH